MQFRYKCIEKWPPLSWLAKCSIDSSEIEVYHGNRVEIQKEWFCEAVWDTKYELGNFDKTDIIFGSGCRIHDKEAIFVSSGSTSDRLHSLQSKNWAWVSNSFICLLSATGGQLDLNYCNYTRDLATIINDLKKYKRTLPTSVGSIRLTYFNNLKWNGKQFIEDVKPYPIRDFSSFSKYRKFLEYALYKTSENMSSTGRKNPYKMIGTLSSGYDSATVVALARQFGLDRAISFDVARGNVIDNGKEIAEVLDVKLLSIKRDTWSFREMPEVPFLASGTNGAEVCFSGAEDYLEGCVLMTGFHGDRIWDKKNKALSDDIIRGDLIGLSLSEYRLWTSFIHCPVPFIGARQIRDINAISNSSEMLSWSVPGDYNRPICRRIIENAGVPRGKFGVGKKAVAVYLFEKDDFFSPGSFKDYLSWLRENSWTWVKNRHFLKGIQRVRNAIRRIALLKLREDWLVCLISKRLIDFADWESLLRRYMFYWAVERAKKRYSTIPERFF